MVRSVAGNLPEQVKNNQSVNTAAGNGGQKMSQYSWFTVYTQPADGMPIILVAQCAVLVISRVILSGRHNGYLFRDYDYQHGQMC